MSQAVFYHAGCPVCIEAERTVAESIDRTRYDVEIVHLGENRARIDEAKGFGVVSVPALVIAGTPFHINHGADLKDL